MLLKRILIASIVASLGVLTAACSDDAEDACEHIKEVCKEASGSSDCSKANDEYDKATDAQKEAYDKIIECVMDAENCEAVAKCSSSAASSGD